MNILNNGANNIIKRILSKKFKVTLKKFKIIVLKKSIKLNIILLKLYYFEIKFYVANNIFAKLKKN